MKVIAGGKSSGGGAFLGEVVDYQNKCQKYELNEECV